MCKDIKLNGIPVICTSQCKLNGFKGGATPKLHTITEQSVMLGATSMQLEIPRSVRAMLGKDDDFCTKLAEIIVDLYEKVVVPGWQKKHNQLPTMKTDESLVSKVTDQEPTLEEIIPVYQQWGESAELRGKSKLLI